MPAPSDSKGFPWAKLWEAFAWSSLLAAFIVGQIAAQTDYEALLRQQMPEVQLSRSQANTELPVVYQVKNKGEVSPDALVMSEGVGYGGALVVAIKARRTEDGARLNEVLMLSHKESPSFMDRLGQKRFFQQFAGKNVSDNFIIGDDVDAVTGATVSSVGFNSAIREAVHLGASQHLDMPITWQQAGWHFGLNELILIGLFALAFLSIYQKGKLARYARIAVAVGSLVFVGFYANASINLGNIASIFMGYIPSPKQHPLWWIMMIGTLGSIFALGRNIYCHQICPFKVVQELLQKLSGIKFRVKPEIQRKSRALIYFLSWAALMLIFLSTHPALGSYEPFAMMFSLEGLGIQWYILPVALIGSLFVPKFWCRLFCPVGLYLNELVRIRRGVKERIFGSSTKGKQPPEREIRVTVTPERK